MTCNGIGWQRSRVPCRACVGSQLATWAASLGAKSWDLSHAARGMFDGGDSSGHLDVPRLSRLGGWCPIPTTTATAAAAAAATAMAITTTTSNQPRSTIYPSGYPWVC